MCILTKQDFLKFASENISNSLRYYEIDPFLLFSSFITFYLSSASSFLNIVW